MSNDPMTMLCPICCDEFDKASLIAKCNFCEYETCTKCAQQYLLGSIENAHCMNCRKGWTRERMLQMFPKKFVCCEYKKHRENVLFDKEKALLPATQPLAEQALMERNMLKEVDKIKEEIEMVEKEFFEKHPQVKEYKEQLATLKKTVAPLVPTTYTYYTIDPLLYLKHNCNHRVCDYPCHGRLVQMSCGSGGSTCLMCNKCASKVCNTCGVRYRDRPTAPAHVCRKENIKEHNKRNALIADYRALLRAAAENKYDDSLNTLNANISWLRTKMRSKAATIRRNIQLQATQLPDVVEKEKKNFVRACPAEGCRGFLSSAWKCGMCNIFACPHCHEVKGNSRDAPHECKPENVETAKLLAKDTKGCPNCGVRIHKISGCSQMWCVECHTAFDWNTGQIARGNIHNPHYYEYVQRHGQGRREIRDIPCGGLPDYSQLMSHFKKYMETKEYAQLDRFHRMIGEIIDLREWYRNRNLEDTQGIRVKYLLKDYDEKTFKRMLQMKAKAHEKVTNIDQVLDMFVMASTTILQRSLTVNSADGLQEIFKELHELNKYMNESMINVGSIYDCKTPWIDEKLVRIHRVGERK